MLYVKVDRPLAGRPETLGVVTTASQRSIWLVFVQRPTVQVIETDRRRRPPSRACFSDVRIAPAVSAFSRDFVAGTRVERLTGVCAFSRDEPTNAQVCVDSAMQVVNESSEWAFGEFPKIDTALANTVKAGMNSVKLSPQATC